MRIRMPDHRSAALLKRADDPFAKMLRAGLDAHDPLAGRCLADADLLPHYFSYVVREPASPAFAAALAIYDRYQLEACGGKPLAEGASEWPEELAHYTGILDVSPAEPVRGWRVWSLAEGYLVAPFGIMKWGDGDRETPGVTWEAGVKVNDVHHCFAGSGLLGEVHPILECRCGVRAMQSLTMLRAYVDHFVRIDDMAPPDALAEVEMWGRVAGAAPGDDWQFTARAQYAQIVGQVHLREDLEPQRAALEQRYRFESGGGSLDTLAGWNRGAALGSPGEA